ncbi:MAG TPA: glycosyltransferase family 4 protein [Polyangiales bacterium]
MKVLLVHDYYQEYGGETVVYEVERRALRDARVHIVEFARHNDELKQYGPLQKLSLPLRTLWAWDTQRTLRELLERERPDIAHFSNTFPLISPAAYRTCQQAGVAVVQNLQNHRLGCPAATFYRDGHLCEECHTRGLQRAVVHACYRGSRAASATVASMLKLHRSLGTYAHEVDRYIAPSQFVRDKLIETAGLPAARVVVKPNFMDDDPGVVAKLGDHALFAGRLVEYKGILTLLSAVEPPHAPVPLELVGTGPLEAQVRERAQVCRAEFVGGQTRGQTIERIKRARVLVVPSLWYEGMPMVILEAFACGVPVVASRLGSMAEMIRHAENGLLFEPGDPSDLRRQLDWAFAHADEMHRFGKQARNDFEMHYSFAAGQRALLQIYRDVLTRRETRSL